ncbi:MAG: shikimate dehydrogenase [Chloroflexi bacterium SZAS-1]|jgi:shikimate dehydrogenase|nr:shikimate dehydrogenase [Chloroflexi bacterium SZAS-1]
MQLEASSVPLFRVGLIGDPVAHSRSPALHNAAFTHVGIPAHYELWHTSTAELPARIAELRQPGTLGANVTLPHKVAVLALLDQIDPDAAVIGAVNTIIREYDGTLTGANTDAPACLASLREDGGFEPAGRSAVILGASGAARAATVALVGAGIAQLTLVNRTLEKAEQVLGDVLAATEANPLLYAITPTSAELPELLASANLIINATSLGWHGNETPLAAEYIPAGALVFDMVYRPTRLLHEAAARSARTLNGAGMLVRQAALAFERWTGQPAPLDVMRAAMHATW